jgi:prepilin signal peptidase PulO-like enzyme (type II secretory pathway)
MQCSDYLFRAGPSVFFDIIDYLLILSAILLGILAAYQDIKRRSFTLLTGIGIAAIGVGWCVKQSFIPIAIFPIACGTAVVLVLNLLIKKKIIGEGDILLMCSAGCFVTLNELPAFMVFCGAGGVLAYALQWYLGKKASAPSQANKAVPFVPAIVASQWITFFLYCVRN